MIFKVTCPIILKREFCYHCFRVSCSCCQCSTSRAAVHHQAVTEHIVARTPQWVLNVWYFWYAHVPAKAPMHLVKQTSSQQINLQGAVRGVSQIWVSHVCSSVTTGLVVSLRMDCQTQSCCLYSQNVRVVLIQAVALMLQNLYLVFVPGLWLLLICSYIKKRAGISEPHFRRKIGNLFILCWCDNSNSSEVACTFILNRHKIINLIRALAC